MKMNQAIDQLKMPGGYGIKRYNVAMPDESNRVAMKWDGEWHITVEVFRDLGLAFAAVLVLIYVLVVGWFRSFIVPLVIMAPIPLTLVGILPASRADGRVLHRDLDDWIHRRRGNHCAQFHHPGRFHRTATRAGHAAGRGGGGCRCGALPADAAARAVVVGASVILFDPIFQGLAISLMAGEVASTLLSRLAVPVLYYMVENTGLRRTPIVRALPKC